jgi:hypothetical protein
MLVTDKQIQEIARAMVSGEHPDGTKRAANYADVAHYVSEHRRQNVSSTAVGIALRDPNPGSRRRALLIDIIESMSEIRVTRSPETDRPVEYMEFLELG